MTIKVDYFPYFKEHFQQASNCIHACANQVLSILKVAWKAITVEFCSLTLCRDATIILSAVDVVQNECSHRFWKIFWCFGSLSMRATASMLFLLIRPKSIIIYVVMYFYVLCQAFDYTPIPISLFVYPNIIALFPPSLHLFQLLFNDICSQWTEIVSLLELWKNMYPYSLNAFSEPHLNRTLELAEARKRWRSSHPPFKF